MSDKHCTNGNDISPLDLYPLLSCVPLYFTFYAIYYVILINYILNYVKLKIWYYESMQLEDSNKISLDYIFSYTLTAIYKISSKDG